MTMDLYLEIQVYHNYPSYTVATLSDTVAGDLALCTDETGGSTVVSMMEVIGVEWLIES